jgi:hypothetical protein
MKENLKNQKLSKQLIKNHFQSQSISLIKSVKNHSMKNLKNIKHTNNQNNKSGVEKLVQFFSPKNKNNYQSALLNKEKDLFSKSTLKVHF